MPQEFTYKGGTIKKEQNSVLSFRAFADDAYDDKDLIEILDIMEELNDGNPFLILMVINDFEFFMTKEARNLFNEYEKATSLIVAEAVVIQSTSTKILYNLLTKVYRPKFPFKAFTSEGDAITWLESHM